MRIKKYSVFSIGNDSDYFDGNKNKEIFRKVAAKCYLPANSLMLDLIEEFNGEFKISYSLSGVFLEQAEMYMPEVITSFQELMDSGCVELLDETYHHSLSFLYSKEEFSSQVRLHRTKIKKMFNFSPRIFRNTELIYNNELAHHIEGMGYEGILAEGADKLLGWRSPNFLYKPAGKNIRLLLKNYKLSDDIAFRFSEKSWKEYPLTAPKFSNWVSDVNGNGNLVNLFMDYETFGEHQWEDKGIFEFLRHLPGSILRNKDNNFVTPSEAVERYDAVGELDVPYAVSWADVERDVSAWLGNRMQQEAMRQIYDLEEAVVSSGDDKLIEDWRKLQTSDHFYYMRTKWFNDGDVHKYFNAFDSPYDSFISFMNILNDFKLRLNMPS